VVCKVVLVLGVEETRQILDLSRDGVEEICLILDLSQDGVEETAKVALGVDLASLVGAIKEAGVLDQIHGVKAMDGMEAGGALVGGVDGVVDMKV
jgi:hypothetical protein